MKIAILGAGQLAQMMAQVSDTEQFEFLFFSPEKESCAAPYGQHLCAAYDDIAAHQRIVDWADVVTYEFENVPLPVVQWLEQRVTLHPSSTVLEVACDRLHEKRNFRRLGVPTAEFVAVDNYEALIRAVDEIGLPAVLKTRTQGYDGKGQAVLRDGADLLSAWEAVGKVPCILESMVFFQRELSIIAARSTKGEMVFYPLSENHHRDGILRLSIGLDQDPLQEVAEDLVRCIMEDLSYVGVMALELFQVGDQLYGNEIAPRVHNSGHWTIEGAQTSQFSNHLRAVCGLPLGKADIIEPVAMVNLIGTVPVDAAIKAIPGTVSHLYGKSERPGRKVGHVALVANGCSVKEFNQRLAQLLQLVREEELAALFLTPK